jgi:hypothetical protein
MQSLGSTFEKSNLRKAEIKKATPDRMAFDNLNRKSSKKTASIITGWCFTILTELMSDRSDVYFSLCLGLAQVR